MKIIKAKKEILEGINILKKYLSFKNKYNISFIEDNKFYIQHNKNNIIVHYVILNEAFYALGQVEFNNFDVIECPFKHIGIMLDNARNGVSNLDSLKRMIVNEAILGYNFVGLYLEDCFEVDNEPFFGYMRGRFSQNEIKQIVEFASILGIEVIPYIQTLAHLNRIFNHYFPYASKVFDMHDVLLMDEPRTYELIDNYISSISKCFKSKHLHVGLDESFAMCEGVYKKKHPEFNRNDVFYRHILKVVEIASKYGFEVEAWGDMFLKHLQGYELPSNLTLTLWSYYNNSIEANDNAINEYKKLTNKLSFASSSHKYYGFIPYNEYASNIIKYAIDSCIKNKIERFVITEWSDDGAECGFFQTLPSLIRTSSNLYKNDNYSKMCMFLTNYTYEELLLLDSPNNVYEAPIDRIVNPSRYLFYMDLFYGLDDKCENPIYKDYFDKYINQFNPLLNRKSKYSYLIDFTYELLKILSIKNCLRLDIIDAYKTKNTKLMMKNLIRLEKLIFENRKFYKLFETRWLKECKPFGYEVMQIRISGVITRLVYIKKEISKFIKDSNYRIEELEQINLEPKAINDRYNGAGIYNRYSQNVTFNTLMTNDYF